MLFGPCINYRIELQVYSIIEITLSILHMEIPLYINNLDALSFDIIESILEALAYLIVAVSSFLGMSLAG